MVSPEKLILLQPGQWKSHKQKQKSKKKLAELKTKVQCNARQGKARQQLRGASKRAK
jgi:hypothetical protein